VVRDHKAAQPNLLLAEDGPELYRPLEQTPSPFPLFVVRSAAPNPASLIQPVKEVLIRDVPERPLSAQPVSQRVDTQLAGVRTNAIQILGFALIGLALALLGVHGVLAYSVGRRTREIGIRGALGAGADSIRWMILRDTALLAAVGVGIGLPAAGMAARSLGTLLHGTSPVDPVVLGGVGVVTLVVALVAGYLPARRAARVDPLVALRTD
jgi:ABC-type antimicrobial peptide transport system permease subunit